MNDQTPQTPVQGSADDGEALEASEQTSVVRPAWPAPQAPVGTPSNEASSDAPPTADETGDKPLANRLSGSKAPAPPVDQAPAPAPAEQGAADAVGDTAVDAPQAAETRAEGGAGETARAPESDVDPETGSRPGQGSVAIGTEDLGDLRTQVATLVESISEIANLERTVAEVARLRVRDTDTIDKLHADNTRLRQGELTAAMAPLLQGLLRLHDQMVSLASGDPHSIAGMLRTQLLQLLDTATGISTFDPSGGNPFDSSMHTGVGRIPTTDAAKDATVARCVRPGFARNDGSIVRVAQVEVYRHQPATAGVGQIQQDPHQQATNPVQSGQE